MQPQGEWAPQGKEIVFLKKRMAGVAPFRNAPPAEQSTGLSIAVREPEDGVRDVRTRSRAVTRATLHSLSHSGLFQAARASRKMFNLKGRYLRFEYTAKTGICGEAHFGNSRISAPLASASSQ